MVSRISELDIRSMGSRLGTDPEVTGWLKVSVISEAAIRSLGAIFGATGLANTDFAVIMSSIPVSKINFFMSHFRLVMSCIWLLVFACFHRISSGDRLQQYGGYS
jgi:hypothetical protein